MKIYEYWDKAAVELEKLGTRQLLAVLDGTRSRRVCSCRFHCGDEVLSPGDREANEKQAALNERVKAILATRPHIERNSRVVPRRQEKKAMRY